MGIMAIIDRADPAAQPQCLAALDGKRVLPGSPACCEAVARLSQAVLARSRQTTPSSNLTTGAATVARWLRRATIAILALFALWSLSIAVLILAYRHIDPPTSALMLLRASQGQPIDQRWVPLAEISPNLVRAVISSEDGRFCSHGGIDLVEIQKALARAKDGMPRGGSTMTMQLAKNLFLWPDRSYLRKALEAPITLGIEATWPKWRIAEVYLNVVEWGPGVFGAEAASRHHFRKSALQLTKKDAALLAVSLPKPLVRQPGNPKPLTRKLARNIVKRTRAMGNRYVGCVLDSQIASR